MIKKLITLGLSLFTFIATMTPIYAVDNSASVDISGEYGIVIDQDNGQILYDKKAKEKMYPASITKILTCIVALEMVDDLDKQVTITDSDVETVWETGASAANFTPGEVVTYRDVFMGAMLPSGADACRALANNTCGSQEKFVDKMNALVKKLGLKDSHFVNTTGIHDPDHYTTAYDLAKLMQYCMKNSTFRTIAGLKFCTVPATNKYGERIFTSTNELLTLVDNRNVASNYYYKYAIAGKTGYTTEAKNCLVSVSNKDGFELISVILSVGLYPNNISGKFVETKSLFNYGYDNYTLRKLREKDAIATQVEVGNGTKETKNLDLLISDDITATIKQSDFNTEFEPEIQINENLHAPIAQGEVLGKITYNIDGISYSADLKASHNVEKSGFITLLIQIVMAVLILFLLYKLLFDGKNKRKKYNKKYRNYYYR